MSSPTPQWCTWWNSTPREPQGLPYRDILWQESLYNNTGAVLEFLRFAFSVFFLGVVSFTTMAPISTNGWWLPNLYIQLWPLHWTHVVDWTAPHRCLVHVSKQRVQGYSLFPHTFHQPTLSPSHLGDFFHSLSLVYGITTHIIPKPEIWEFPTSFFLTPDISLSLNLTSLCCRRLKGMLILLPCVSSLTCNTEDLSWNNPGGSI